MRYIALFLMLFLVGCSTKSVNYTLPNTLENSSIKTTKVQIGVEKVEIPPYLMQDKVVVVNGNKVEQMDAKFAASLDSLLTKRAIKNLKKLLNNPNVFLYPWDVNAQKGYIVKIVIDDFIYSNNEVKLTGSYYIKDSSNKVLISKNFSLQSSSSIKADNIIYNLSKLFDKLTVEIAQKIGR